MFHFPGKSEYLRGCPPRQSGYSCDYLSKWLMDLCISPPRSSVYLRVCLPSSSALLRDREKSTSPILRSFESAKSDDGKWPQTRHSIHCWAEIVIYLIRLPERSRIMSALQRGTLMKSALSSKAICGFASSWRKLTHRHIRRAFEFEEHDYVFVVSINLEMILLVLEAIYVRFKTSILAAG